ncbi:membrane protein insertion efficiency factor YidD [uncultured Sunxiuqinia sp.]|uniref:membrane protein insertion efficiency factor YidD n=1 Tax=Sunxiuqinia rutila TaxID=1397841 RepID=UPI00343E9BBE
MINFAHSKKERTSFMQCVAKMILKVLGWLLLLPVYFYKYAISPLTPASCRHVPTCSQYAVDAVKIHGPFKGFWLAVRRISKCHPWGTHGYDPVPDRDQIKVKKLKLK